MLDKQTNDYYFNLFLNLSRALYMNLEKDLGCRSTALRHFLCAAALFMDLACTGWADFIAAWQHCDLE